MRDRSRVMFEMALRIPLVARNVKKRSIKTSLFSLTLQKDPTTILKEKNANLRTTPMY